MKKLHFSFIAIILAILSGCVKDQYDKPDPITDPNIDVNYSIEDLKNAFITSGNTLMIIEGDYVISGIVTADDKSNNFYKEIVIQDGTAAIGIKIDRTNLYNEYPIGRKVYVYLKGLAIGKYNELIQLGGYIDSVTVSGSQSLGGITNLKLSSTIIKGSLGNSVTPKEVTISALNNSMQYMLVKLSNVEFDCDDVNNTYADAVNQNDASRQLNDCNGSKLIVRSSGYSEFAGSKLPEKNGDFTAIYTVYKTDKQLKIRDLNDIQMDKNRCVACQGTGGGGGGGGSGGAPEFSTIKDLRSQFNGSGVEITGKYIEGVVISDKDFNNINSRNLVIQDETGGILVRFREDHSFSVGTKLKITFDGDSMILYRKLLEMDYVPLTAVEVLGNETVKPIVMDLATINNNYNQYESMLVRVENASITGGSIYKGSLSLSDATANITLYTASTATFANDPVATGTRNVTGILSIYNTTKQIQLRNTVDVE